MANLNAQISHYFEVPDSNHPALAGQVFSGVGHLMQTLQDYMQEHPEDEGPGEITIVERYYITRPNPAKVNQLAAGTFQRPGTESVPFDEAKAKEVAAGKVKLPSDADKLEKPNKK